MSIVAIHNPGTLDYQQMRDRRKLTAVTGFEPDFG
jgi:hypothetical protein